MATLLGQLFREQVSKSKDYKMKVETEANVAYPTGYLSFDFLNGSIIHVKAEGLEYKYYSVGIVDGSMNMFIGRSGCGKTSFTTQIAANIVDKFPTACLFHDDIEGGLTEARKAILTKWDEEKLKTKYISRNTGITAENFYQRIRTIANIKLENRDAYLYDTECLDSNGEKIYKLEPTVYILDSLALLTPEKYSEEEELSGQMSTTATAKANAQIFRRIIPLLKSANIILFIINHINDKVEINPFKKSKLQVAWLKEGETLPGGRTPIYLANNIIRFDDSKMSAKDGLGIDGSLVDITLVKSRTNKAGKSITLLFNQETGFDPDLSLYIMLKQHKKINGAGAYLYIGDRSDIKFRQSEIKEKLLTNKEFAQIFSEACMDCLKELIKDVQEEQLFANSDVSNNILDMINQVAA